MEDLNQKLEAQNKQVEEIIKEEKSTQEKISKQFNEEISNFIENLKVLNNISPQQFQNPLTFGLSRKISEFNMKISRNEEMIKKK